MFSIYILGNTLAQQRASSVPERSATLSRNSSLKDGKVINDLEIGAKNSNSNPYGEKLHNNTIVKGMSKRILGENSLRCPRSQVELIKYN